MLGCFLIGLALGAGTGVPIGAVGVAVIDAAYRRPFRRAVGVGLGGATGDLLYSGLGVLGLGAILARHPGWPPVLNAMSGAALMLYGALHLRASRRPIPPAGHAAVDGSHRGHARAGYALGLGLVLANPASVITWVVIVGGFLSGVSTLEGVSAVVGVGSGSAAWFLFLAYAGRRGTVALGHRAVWIGRVAGVLLVCYGLVSLGRGARYWLAG